MAHFRAKFLLLWSGESGGVPFSLRENGHKCKATLYTHRNLLLSQRLEGRAARRGTPFALLFCGTDRLVVFDELFP
jgi:hypothetical protein